jgi:iron-sulfur cluster assembly protein
VPKSLTGGRNVITSIVIVPRKEVPGKLLAMSYFPVFADPDTKMAMMIPGRYWPAAFQQAWVQQAADVHRQIAENDGRQEREFEQREIDPTKPIVDLTEAAAAKVLAIIQQEQLGNARLHVGVKARGAGSLEYAMGFTVDPVDRNQQIEYECRGVMIIVDKKDIKYLHGTTINFRNEPNRRGFEFDNPNAM